MTVFEIHLKGVTLNGLRLIFDFVHKIVQRDIYREKILADENTYSCEFCCPLLISYLRQLNKDAAIHIYSPNGQREYQIEKNLLRPDRPTPLKDFKLINSDGRDAVEV